MSEPAVPRPSTQLFSPYLLTLVVAHDEDDVGPRPRRVKVLGKQPLNAGGRRRRLSSSSTSLAATEAGPAGGPQNLGFVVTFPPGNIRDR